MRTRLTGVALFTAMILVSASYAFAEMVVRCESDSYRYRYCRVDTGNRVRIQRELSDTQCVRGRSWGYDYRGIWVDDGCRADFLVGGGRPGGSAIAGGILGSMIGGYGGGSYPSYDDGRRRSVPNWAIGTFRGYDPVIERELEFVVYPHGDIMIWQRGKQSRGKYHNEQIAIERGGNFDVQRERNGFTIIERRDRRHLVRLYRVR